jgi:hypothetical protein
MRRDRAAMLLMLMLAAGCAGPDESPPHWRRIDPSASEPPQRWQMPDDSFSATLAEAGRITLPPLVKHG